MRVSKGRRIRTARLTPALVIAVSAVSAVLLSSILFAEPQSSASRDTECASWQDCRRLALEAGERQDYEAFHDLAWRAVQKGPRNDSALLTLLARAQSLSGRPHDALVMLQRLAAMGVATDAATNDDFRRVRALPGWSDVERSLAEAAERNATRNAPAPAAPGTKMPAPPRGTPEEARSKGVSTDTEVKTEASAKPKTSTKAEANTKAERPANKSDANSAVAPTKSDAGAATTEESLVGDAAEAIRFTAPAFTPAGLAYDDVSDRFIVGDRRQRKLTVVDEASQRVAILAGAQSTGFGEIAAFEIDAHQGDLWVVSTAEEEPRGTTLHKLQLISARVLYALPLPESFGAAQFTDVAVSPHGTVIALDALGDRLFSVAPKSHDFKLAAKLDAKNVTSVAPASDSTVYVAHDKGVVQVDLASRRSRSLRAAKKVDLARLTRIRWHHGSLVGTQKASDGSFRVVRIRLSSDGRTATGLDVLDRSISMSDPTAAALSSDVFYYLVDSTGGETIVRRVTVK